MTAVTPISFSEEELNTLVSIAIRRAEILDEQKSSSSREAWSEVMAYEERLASITKAADIPGGIARVGAIRAALAAGQRHDASRLKTKYLKDRTLTSERRAAIEQVFKEDQTRQEKRYPSLAKIGRLVELEEWRNSMTSRPHVFPCVAV